MRKLDILVPHYKEPEQIGEFLLKSIAIQRNVNFDEIGVIICNDGNDVVLSKEFLSGYTFEIEYYICEHKGVSATRNACLDHSKAEYVMFCDFDDGFLSVLGLWLIFREMNSGFDTLSSAFSQESIIKETNETIFINREKDTTFVHGKIHRRKYLLDKNIRWNENLTIHEDSYFNCLCQEFTKNRKYLPAPFYLWINRNDSVCRNDDKYLIKTYTNLLDSNIALVKAFLTKEKKINAQYHFASMIYDMYFAMNTKEWFDIENAEYREKTYKKFREYYIKYKALFTKIPKDIEARLLIELQNKIINSKQFINGIEFEDWLENVIKENNND